MDTIEARRAIDRQTKGGDSPVPRTRAFTIRLTEDEHEWLRRKAHWDGEPMTALLRRHLHALIAEEGYLRPPDDEPQDFGYEKELMQFVLSVQNSRDSA
jgi:hypothetical protein